MESALVGLGQIALGVVFIVPLVMYFAQDALIFQPHVLPTRPASLSNPCTVNSAVTGFAL